MTFRATWLRSALIAAALALTTGLGIAASDDLAANAASVSTGEPYFLQPGLSLASGKTSNQEMKHG